MFKDMLKNFKGSVRVKNTPLRKSAKLAQNYNF